MAQSARQSKRPGSGRLAAVAGRLQQTVSTQLMIGVLATGLISGLPAVCDSLCQTLIEAAVPTALVQLLKLTAPLTLSVAVVTLALRRDWLSWGGPVAAAGILLAGAWLGRWWGHDGAAEAVTLFSDAGATASGAVTGAVNQLAGYWLVYGPRQFVLAVAAGVWMGILWDGQLAAVVKLLRGESKRPAAQKRTPSQRRAA